MTKRELVSPNRIAPRNSWIELRNKHTGETHIGPFSYENSFGTQYTIYTVAGFKVRESDVSDWEFYRLDKPYIDPVFIDHAIYASADILNGNRSLYQYDVIKDWFYVDGIVCNRKAMPAKLVMVIDGKGWPV